MSAPQKPDPGEPRRPLRTTLAHAAKVKSGGAQHWAALDARVRPWLQQVFEKKAFPAGVSAEDLIQEVMLEAYRDFDKFIVEPSASFRGWVLKIAEMRLLDVWRRAHAKKRDVRKVRSIEGEGDEPGLDPAADADQSQTMLARVGELQERLQSVIATMTARQQQILELRLFDEVPFEKVCQIMGFDSADTARSFLSRTKEALRRKLEAFR